MVVVGLLQLVKLLQLFKFQSASLICDSIALVIFGFLFRFLSLSSTFTVSFRSSSTGNYSNLLVESTLSFNLVNRLLISTFVLFCFLKRKPLRFQDLHFPSCFGHRSVIDEFLIIGDLLIRERFSSNVFMI